MLLKWKRSVEGHYESNATFWDAEARLYKSLYVLERTYTYPPDGKKTALWDFIERGKGRFKYFKTFQEAKRHAQEIENQQPESVVISRRGEIMKYRKVEGVV
jgi:hypothetical protein